MVGMGVVMGVMGAGVMMVVVEGVMMVEGVISKRAVYERGGVGV